MRNLLNLKVWLGLCLAAVLAPAGYGACNYSVSPSGRSHGNGAATNTLTVTVEAGCAWSVSNPNSWITILAGASGTGTGTVTYAVSANIDSVTRVGVLTVSGQTFSVQQGGVPCNYSLSPTTRTHGYGAANNSISITAATNCVWTASDNAPWITFTGTTNGVANGTVPYAVFANPTPVQRTGNVFIADQTFVLVQHAAPCLYELSPTNRLHGYGGSTGLVTITASPGCAWFVDNTNSWISITANPAGTNNGTFGYTVAANPNSTPRNATFMVWDQVFGVYQQPTPCNYSIAPTSVAPSSELETNLVTVTAVGGCAWGVTNTNSWISFTFPTNGTGNGTLGVITAANPGLNGRTGVVSIAGQNFTVRQDGLTCTYRLSPTNRVHGYGATANTIGLTAGSICAWTVVNTNPWVTLTPTNGTGNATINYTLPQNNGAGDRIGIILIGGQPFSLTQRGIGCAINLSPSARNHGYAAATNTISIGIGIGCNWGAVNTNSWITILSATNGTGSNVLTYAVAANPAGLARSGNLTIEEGVVAISQNAAPCTFSITPGSYSHSPVQETGTVAVTSLVGCNWTVDNTNAWITLLSGTNGTASTNVSYQVGVNLNPNSRTGLVTIASQLYTVIQDGVTCSYKIAPTNRIHGYAATTNTMTMTVSNPCPWSVVNTNPWLTILSGSNGVGSGTITYAVSANSSTPDDRVGYVVVSGAVSIITQHGLVCSVAISPTNRNHGYNAATGLVTVTAGPTCTWPIVNTNAWITILPGAAGIGNGTVSYAVSSNGTATARSGNVAIDGQLLAISQSPFSCTYKLSPTNRTHGFGANTNSVNVIAGPGCAWTVATTNDWIQISSAASGAGNGSVTYTISPNFGSTTRLGVLTLDDQTLVISQLGATNGFSFESVIINPGGDVTVRLAGAPAGIWELQSSTNLVNWVKIADLTNVTGRVERNIPAAAAEKRFFRTVLP